MSGNVPTPMDLQDPRNTSFSKAEQLETEQEEFRKEMEDATLERLKQKAEMLEDKAAEATTKASFARAYYDNEKKLIEKRQTAHQQRKKGKSLLKIQREKLIKLHRAERDRKNKARDEAEDRRKLEEY